VVFAGELKLICLLATRSSTGYRAWRDSFARQLQVTRSAGKWRPGRLLLLLISLSWLQSQLTGRPGRDHSHRGFWTAPTGGPMGQRWDRELCVFRPMYCGRIRSENLL